MQSTSDSLEWVKIFPSLIGTIIGGLITLTSLWAKEFFDRRRALQSWYEENYIEQGIDQLLAFVTLIEFHLMTSRGNALFGKERQIEYPLDAFIKTDTLLKSPDVLAVPLVYSELLLWEKAEIVKLQQSERERMRTLVGEVRERLAIIRERLLKIKIKQKSDVHTIHNRYEIKSLVDELDKKYVEIMRSKEEIKEILDESLAEK